MAQILPLSVQARLVTVQALLDLRDHSPRTAVYLRQLLKTDLYTAVSESILQQIVEQFPGRLHCDLLKVLTPPHIRELKIRKCWSVSVLAIADILGRCCKIQVLDLSECDHLMQPPFFKLLHNLAPQLTSLTVENCELINDRAVQTILSNNPGLRQLNISMCENVTDKAFLLDEKLQLSRETKMKVHGVDRYGYPCHLTHIDVSGCRVLTSSGIRYLTTLCGPTLQHVNISYTEVDSTALWYLAGYGLTSAVHMAIAYMMEVNTEGAATTQLSELVKYMNEVSFGPDDFSDYSDESDTEIEDCDQNLDHEHNIQHHLDGDKEVKTESTIEEPCVSEERYSENMEELSENECECENQNDTDGVDRCLCFTVEMMPVLDWQFIKCTCMTQMPSEINGNEHLDTGPNNSGNIPRIEIEHCPSEGSGRGLGMESCVLDVKSSCQVHSEVDNASGISESSHSIVANRRFSNPLKLQRCGYGENDDLLYNKIPSRKSSDISDISFGDHEEAKCLSPQRSIMSEQSLDECSDVFSSGIKPRDEHPISEEQPSCKTGFQDSSQDNSPDAIWWEEKEEEELNGAVAAAPKESKVVPNTIKNKMKPHVSVEFQNDTLTLPTKKNGESTRNTLRKPYSELLQIYEPNIRVLDMSHIALNSKELVHSCMKAFFQRNSHVRQLSLAWKELGDEMLRFIADHAKELKVLSLIDCDGLTSDGISYLCQQCPQLTRLNLQGVCFISDSALDVAIQSGRLVSLNLAETNMTDHTLLQLARHGHEQLLELDLSWCEELFDEQYESSPGLDLMMRNCRKLKSLLLRHLPCSPDSLQLMVSHCVNLQTLNLSSVNSLSDKLLVAMSVRLKKLEKLDISWNSALSDIGVGAIMANCLYLKELSVAGIKLLTSKPFLPLVSEVREWRRCQALLRLKLQEQQKLEEDEHYSSDEEFESLCLPHRSTCYAPHLRWLDAEYCDKVNDTHLAEIVAVCRGTLRARDYYGQNVTPTWIQCKRGKVFLAPTV